MLAAAEKGGPHETKASQMVPEAEFLDEIQTKV